MKRIMALLIVVLLCALACMGCAKPVQAEEPTPTPVQATPSAAPVAAPVFTPMPAPTPVTFPAKGFCNGEGVNLRAEPSTSSDVVDIMGENAVLDVMSLQDGWYKINMGGVTAYVAEDLVTLGEPPRPDNMRWAKVSVKESQLYKSPAATDISDVKLKEGDVVKVLRTIGEYLHIVHQGNLQRYLKATDVAFISAAEALGTQTPEPGDTEEADNTASFPTPTKSAKPDDE